VSIVSRQMGALRSHRPPLKVPTGASAPPGASPPDPHPRPPAPGDFRPPCRPSRHPAALRAAPGPAAPGARLDGRLGAARLVDRREGGGKRGRSPLRRRSARATDEARACYRNTKHPEEPAVQGPRNPATGDRHIEESLVPQGVLHVTGRTWKPLCYGPRYRLLRVMLRSFCNIPRNGQPTPATCPTR